MALALVGQIALQAADVYRRRFIVQTEEKVESLYLGVSPQRLWMLSLLAAAAGALLLGVVANFAPVLVIAGRLRGKWGRPSGRSLPTRCKRTGSGSR